MFPWVIVALQRALKTIYGLIFRPVNPTVHILNSIGFELLCSLGVPKLLRARSWGYSGNEDVLDLGTELVWFVVWSELVGWFVFFLFVYILHSGFCFWDFLRSVIDTLSQSVSAGERRYKSQCPPCPAKMLYYGMRHHSFHLSQPAGESWLPFA